jgi:uncharacterized membrane protein YozB (DUF420 family)
MNEGPDIQANVTLAFQIVILVLLLYGYWLFRSRRYRDHGVDTSAALALHTITILYVMIPMLLDEYDRFISVLQPASTINLALHVITGSTAEILAVLLVVRWLMRGLNIKGCFGKTLMKVTFYTWMVSIATGIINYLTHFITPS